MPLKLLIAADDFTGALDTAVQFSARGAAAWMEYGNSDLEPPEGTEVLSVDLETRHCTPETARARAQALFRLAKEKGIPYLYKKTDSAMRGNVGAELAALSEVYGGKPILFVPAFPKMGRTVQNGVLRIQGTPVAETEFAHDPLNPVCRSDVCGLLAEQGAERAISVRLDRFIGQHSGDAPFWAFDGETETELRQIGAYLAKEGLLQLTAGNAGFGAVLAEQISWAPHRAALHRKPGGILLICGSLHANSAAQAAYAEEQLGFFAETLPEGLAECRGGWDTAVGSAVRYRLSQALQSGKNAVVRTAKRGGRVDTDAAQAVSANLGELCRELLQTGAVGTLLIFGGDTLLGVMKALGCRRLCPVSEVCPGVVASHLEIGFGGVVITKAGSFGEPALLRSVLHFLSEGQQ